MRLLIASILVVASQPLGATVPERAIQLRNQGIAELENETPVRAETTFRELTKLTPDDPLPFANLAIASLRQQKFDQAWEWISRADELAPGDPGITAIQAEIHHWSGDSPAALAAFRRAADAAPENLDFQYSLFRQAASTNEPGADDAARTALDRLARLRPENLVVLLQLGQRARVAGDRAAASAVYLRIQELIWQAPRGADALLERILDGLEANELEGLRSSALRLENVLKITPMYKEGLRELSSGIQGIPLTKFKSEPEPTSWGPPSEIAFVARRVADAGGSALAVGDLDGDEIIEIARLAGVDNPRLEIRRPGNIEKLVATASAPEIRRLRLADLDNDGQQELLGHGADAAAVWKFDGVTLGNVTPTFGLQNARGTAATAIDFDIEGDLDLVLAGAGVSLLRNSLEGSLEDVSEKSLPDVELTGVQDLLASDLDRDGDIDLLAAHAKGLTWLDNLRQGRFTDRSADLQWTGEARRIAGGDLDNDGLPDLVVAGRTLEVLRSSGSGFVPAGIEVPDSGTDVRALIVFDADNDGRLDVAGGGENGAFVLLQRQSGFETLPLAEGPGDVEQMVAVDLDRDGDLDLVANGASGLFLLTNEGGNRNRHLSVRLRGLNKGNSKNNVFGIGSAVEVKAGTAYQFREVRGETVHFGLGSIDAPDLMRVVWTNGVPQNRLRPETNQRIVEEQLLKGSCPFLYADHGRGFEFVTDLLWGAPLGLPIAAGRYLGADPTELVYIGPLPSSISSYEIRITEELWEAAFFDLVRLWVVDHPTETEAASSLRIQPGQEVPEEIRLSRSARPVSSAWDASGREVTDRVAERDEVYADGWTRSPYQGVAEAEWSFVVDLGVAPNAPIRMLLDGWIFPTDASLNLALAQRQGPQPSPPSLEVETETGWQPLVRSMGFPAGKTKTMVVDTPRLPQGARRLRIVSGQWLSWDRIAWTTQPADHEARTVARLAPTTADLRYRGFSRLVRRAPNAPHTFDYSNSTPASPWLPFPGRYTRFGDVRELLLETDDQSVILGPGDEIAVGFDLSRLPPPQPGMTRSVFLESHGWDKDADRNTGAGLQVEPLPYRSMTGYPYGPGEGFPKSSDLEDYIERWLTRVVPRQAPTLGLAAP